MKHIKIWYVRFQLIYLVLSGFGYFFSANAQETNDKLFTTYYEEYGAGRPVLIINGGPGMPSEGFADVAKKIAEAPARAIMYDQRGTGKSVSENNQQISISMDLMAGDIENLRKKLRISSWVVFGHSFGGLLATHYAAKYPDRVDGLIFSSSGGIDLDFLKYIQSRSDSLLGPQYSDTLRHYNTLLQAPIQDPDIRKKRASILAKAYVFDDHLAPVIAERLLQVNMAVNAKVFDDLLKTGFDYNGKFRHFHKPVLILQGENDIIAMETAENIKKTFLQADLIKLPDCGHYGWLEQEETYMKAIYKFLNTL